MTERADNSVPVPPLDAEPHAASNEMSVVKLMNTVLRSRRLIVATPLLLFVVVVGYTLLQDRSFTASASFIREPSSGEQSLASSLAAQFAVSIPSRDGGQSLGFYGYLIRSREILTQLLDSMYLFRDGEREVQGRLPELFGIVAETNNEEREQAIEALRDRVAVRANRETGLVTLSVRTAWAELSYLIARDIIDLTNRFNLERRKSRAGAERKFVESRLIAVEGELREVENALQSFLQRNRLWRGAAQLEFVHDRLQRDVMMRQEIFTTLSVAHDRGRIDEVRDTPIITVVEHPEIPAGPDRRYLFAKGLLAVMVGSLIAVLGAVAGEAMMRGRRREVEEFARLKGEAFQDLRHPWRLLRR